MTSAVAICSNALMLLGDDPIASFGEATKRATLCANLWPQVRDALLRSHPWACTRERVVLPRETAAPAFDWGASFLLPGDCLRVLQVGQRGQRIAFELQGRRLLADAQSLAVVYQKRVDDPVLWDAVMVDAATAEMAARLAYPITQSASLAELKRGEAERAKRLARSISGLDNPPEDWADSPFVDARY